MILRSKTILDRARPYCSALSKTALSFARVALKASLIYTFHAEAATKSSIICEFEQAVRFADEPATFPNGPAYLSSDAPKPDLSDGAVEADFERERMQLLDEYMKTHRGATFSVDLTNGDVRSIPFGSKKIGIIQFLERDVKAVMFTPKETLKLNRQIYIGFFSTRRNNYIATLVIDAASITGERLFQFVGEGQTMFGRCYP